MKKTIIFYSLLAAVVILSVSEMNLVTVPALFVALALFGSYACSMSIDELENVIGVTYFNKVFNTNDFSEE